MRMKVGYLSKYAAPGGSDVRDELEADSELVELADKAVRSVVRLLSDIATDENRDWNDRFLAARRLTEWGYGEGVT